MPGGRDMPAEASLERSMMNVKRSTIHASEGATAAAPADQRHAGSLAALLTRHVLRDGEIVLMILRPSLFFVPLSSLRFIAAVVLLMLAGHVYDEKIPYSPRFYLEAGIFVIAGRVTWALLQWMGRLYVLTDMRIVSITGVWNSVVFECPLRKVARTRLTHTLRERLLGLGSIEIIPQDEESPIGYWQMVSRPRRVHERVLSAIRRARQGGIGSP